MRVVLGKLNDELLINFARRGASACSEVHAAVAYAQGADHPLLQACKEKKGLKLTFYGLLDEDGAVGVSFLKELRSWGASRADVRVVKDGLTGATGVTLVGEQAFVLVEHLKAVAVPYRAAAPVADASAPPRVDVVPATRVSLARDVVDPRL